MDTLDPATLRVETFQTAAEPLPDGGLSTTMRTHERDCTMPGLCPETW